MELLETFCNAMRLVLRMTATGSVCGVFLVVVMTAVVFADSAIKWIWR